MQVGAETRRTSLRSKRLAKDLDPEAARFLDSTPEDAALVKEDVLGSIAHAAVLEDARILTADEARRIREALAQLYATADTFQLDADLEDVHMNVEAWLTQRLGDLGKKLHTARSRNDQVALDLRLWTRRALLALAAETHHLAEELLDLAHRYPAAILPGHTHFQIGQPVLLSHHLGAHVARLARDLGRLEDAYARANVSPLGAGALAGTSHPIDPAVSAKLLGFAEPFANSMDAVSDRDFVHEALFVEALLLNHVSALAEEIILFTHPAFGFATIDDAHATGSSLMPQKKNPDVFEVARAKAATVLGALTASLAQAKALPLAYNRDFQEQKRLFLESFSAGLQTVRVVAGAVGGLTFHPEAMARLAGAGHADATDLADYLVRKGVPFRDAHGLAGQAVQEAIKRGAALDTLPLAVLRTIHPKIQADVQNVLGARNSVKARTSPGGTAPEAAQAALARVREEVERASTFLNTELKRLLAVEKALLAEPAPGARRKDGKTRGAQVAHS